MSLKEITKDLHHEAETTIFAKMLLSGKIGKEDYRNYLYNLLAIYDPIEWYCKRQGFFTNMKDLPRLKAILADFCELDNGEYVYLTPATLEYQTYLHKLGNDPERKHLIKAHLYCRHMGDLFGGQIIKKQVAHISNGKFYEFENADTMKVEIRKILTDDLGDEARVAFEYAIKMMKDLYNGK
jgi:heme oxygenase (biliverdin-producing, ferredoxin)